MRLFWLAVLALVAPVAAQQPPPNANPVVLSGTTSRVHVASPDETIVVNGRLMKVSEFVAVLSSLDSLEGQRLRSPETRNHESAPPIAPPKRASSECSAAGQEPQADSCSPTVSKPQAPETKLPH